MPKVIFFKSPFNTYNLWRVQLDGPLGKQEERERCLCLSPRNSSQRELSVNCLDVGRKQPRTVSTNLDNWVSPQQD